MDVIQKLTETIKANWDEWQFIISTGNFGYETFGKDFESIAFSGLIKAFPEAKLSTNKNSFPDISIGTLAVDIKCANVVKKDGDCWKTVDKPANDLGTLRSWKGKASKFEEIYFLFVEYHFDDDVHRLVNFHLKPAHHFAGYTNGKISYRLKDGNVRPRSFKDFLSPSLFSSMQHFLDEVDKAEVHRRNKIVRAQAMSVKEIEALVAEFNTACHDKQILLLVIDK